MNLGKTCPCSRAAGLWDHRGPCVQGWACIGQLSQGSEHLFPSASLLQGIEGCVPASFQEIVPGKGNSFLRSYSRKTKVSPDAAGQLPRGNTLGRFS